MLAPFMHGYLLALGLILPLGPQNAFVLSQGAAQADFRRALPVVIAAGVCDTLLILLAVLGVSTAALTFPLVKIILIVVGVAFLLIVGWLTWRSSGTIETAESPESLAHEAWPIRRQIIFAISVSLLNPHAILDTIGVIGTSSLAYAGDLKTSFTAGVLINSWLWFLGLAIVGRLVGRLDTVRRWLARASAVIMWISAVYLASTLL
jgi:L-lysine exporter family protein LysE/ArgO